MVGRIRRARRNADAESPIHTAMNVMDYAAMHTADARDREARIPSLVGALIFHAVVLIIFAFVSIGKPPVQEFIEVDWGSSSGAPNQSTVEPTAKTAEQEAAPRVQPQPAQKPKVETPVAKSPSQETLPALTKAAPPKTETKTQTAATPKATGRRAERTTPAGSGRSTGYSIEWSGVGSRKLLSGRMPRYPDGTDKQMAVLLQFTVLPDGSVIGIIPLRRSDELLEREAIAALRTWRFDPLPTQYEQGPQTGKVTFNFVLQ